MVYSLYDSTVWKRLYQSNISNYTDDIPCWKCRLDLYFNYILMKEEEKLKSDIDIKVTDNDRLWCIGCSLGCALWLLFLWIILILLIKIRMLIWNAL